MTGIDGMSGAMGRHNLIIAAFAASAIALAWFGVRPAYDFAKAATTLVVIAFYWRFVKKLAKSDFFVGLLAFVFCLGGDVALLFDGGFIFGLSSFLIGHILFIILFGRLADKQLNWLAVLLTFSIGAAYYVFISAELATEAIPVAVYTTVIALMGAWGISLHLNARSSASLLVMLGGLAFMFSDGVLSYNRFVESSVYFHPIVLSSYWLALALIANGLARFNRA